MFYKKRIELLEKQVDTLIESRAELFREYFIILQRLRILENRKDTTSKDTINKAVTKIFLDEYLDKPKKSKKLK